MRTATALELQAFDKINKLGKPYLVQKQWNAIYINGFWVAANFVNFRLFCQRHGITMQEIDEQKYPFDRDLNNYNFTPYKQKTIMKTAVEGVSLIEACVEAGKLSKSSKHYSVLEGEDGDFSVVEGDAGEEAYLVYFNGSKLGKERGESAPVKKVAAAPAKKVAAPAPKAAAPVKKQAAPAVAAPKKAAAKAVAPAKKVTAPVKTAAAPKKVVAQAAPKKVAAAPKKVATAASNGKQLPAQYIGANGKPKEKPFRWISELVEKKGTVTLAAIRKKLAESYAANTTSGQMSLLKNHPNFKIDETSVTWKK